MTSHEMDSGLGKSSLAEAETYSAYAPCIRELAQKRGYTTHVLTPYVRPKTSSPSLKLVTPDPSLLTVPENSTPKTVRDAAGGSG